MRRAYNEEIWLSLRKQKSLSFKKNSDRAEIRKERGRDTI